MKKKEDRRNVTAPQPGVFRLTRDDIHNRNYDRREKFDWTKLGNFPAGLYHVTTYDPGFDKPATWLRIRRLTAPGGATARYGSIDVPVRDGLINIESSVADMISHLVPDSSMEGEILREQEEFNVTPMEILLAIANDGEIGKLVLRRGIGLARAQVEKETEKED